MTSVFSAVFGPLSPDLHGGMTLDVFMSIASTADIGAIIREASVKGVIQNCFTNTLCAAVSDARPGDAVKALFERVETFSSEGQANRDELKLAVDHDVVEGCFYGIADESFGGFANFESTLARLLRMTDAHSDSADAIAGMAPGAYWSHLLAACEPLRDEFGKVVRLSDTRPAFWADCVRYALDHGMTAESLVVCAGDTTSADPAGTTEGFRDAIKKRAGAGCAAIFDAIVAERAMRARLDATMRTDMGGSGRRRTPV